MKANYSKSEELIRDVIDEYENMELNIASPVARETVSYTHLTLPTKA